MVAHLMHKISFVVRSDGKFGASGHGNYCDRSETFNVFRGEAGYCENEKEK